MSLAATTTEQNPGFNMTRLSKETAAAAIIPAALVPLGIVGAELSDGAGKITRPMLRNAMKNGLKAGGVGAILVAEMNLLRDVKLPENRMGAMGAGGAVGATAGALGALGITTVLQPGWFNGAGDVSRKGVFATAIGVAAAGFLAGSLSGIIAPDRNVLPF